MTVRVSHEILHKPRRERTVGNKQRGTFREATTLQIKTNREQLRSRRSMSIGEDDAESRQHRSAHRG